jgi:hypothetical protein
VLAIFAIRQAPPRLIRYALGSLLVLAGGWFAYAHGSGPYYRGPIVADVTPAVIQVARDSPSGLVGALDQARTGFVLSGGATNTTVPERVEPPAGPTMVQQLRHRARLAAVGLAVVFTPISLLQASSIVEFAGGRGLLPLADIDTMFLDVSMLAVLVLLFRRRQTIGDRLPFIVFGITLSLVTAVLLGYVVTNFGTLFRIRLIVGVPIWTLALALSHSRRGRVLPGTGSRIRLSPARVSMPELALQLADTGT